MLQDKQIYHLSADIIVEMGGDAEQIARTKKYVAGQIKDAIRYGVNMYSAVVIYDDDNDQMLGSSTSGDVEPSDEMRQEIADLITLKGKD